MKSTTQYNASSANQKWSLSSIVRDTRGLSTVEYIILLVVIVVGSVGIWNEIGSDLVGKLGSSRDSLGKVGSSEPAP